MPEILRDPHRMLCAGVDLVHPVDRMPEGAFPYLLNMRVVQESRLEMRPGYTLYDKITPAGYIHSFRRLNDPGLIYAPMGYTNIVGIGTNLYSGVQGSLNAIQSGFSGNPLSLITFRPQNSPDSWMYVYDSSQSIKVRPDGLVQDVGAAPTGPPAVTYGQPEEATVYELRSMSVGGWHAYGAASSPTAQDRTNTGAPTIQNILYDSGTTGWCCICPTSSVPFDWAGIRMRIVLQSGSELVAVRELHPAITTTTIQAIQYDAGTTGPCSIVLTGSPANLARNSLLKIGTEVIKVQAVVLSPDGITYSVRCTTTLHHANGAGVNGLLSWYVYTIGNHVVSETITSLYVAFSQSASGTGNAGLLLTENAATSAQNNRPISTANDYFHFSIFLQNPQFVTSITLLVDIDPGTTSVGSGGNAFTNNFWTWTIPAAEIIEPDQQGSLGDAWFDFVMPISTGTQVGNDRTLNFSDVMAVGVQVISTGACAWGFGSWYFFGTYGPFVQPNSPTGLLYQSVVRDSTTGTASVPSPTQRYDVFPLNEAVIVTPQAPPVSGFNLIDIYRQGNTLTSPTYDGTVPYNSGAPQSFKDIQSDTTIQANPGPDLSLLQPWPILQPAWSGTVNVVGTTVEWVSGDQFDMNLVQDSVITINGTAYLTYGQPASIFELMITSSAGVQNGVPYQINSPTLANQSLPYAFGPLEGPFAPVIFALGDPLNAGTLYYSNSANADGASDQNTLEICAPSEPLISGETWNGICIVGSHDNLFVVRYSYLTTIGIESSGPVVYQFQRIPANSGMWCRWGCVRGADGVYYIGQDGIYRATDQGAVNISDEMLYPLFPHEGQPASPTNQYQPVDMTQETTMRLTRTDQDIKFWYTDILGASMCMQYEYLKKRWFAHSYGDQISLDYLIEEGETQPNRLEILSMTKTSGNIYVSGGNDDNGVTITGIWRTPSFDQGDERLQKLYVDTINDFDQLSVTPTNVNIQFGYNNNSILGPLLMLAVVGVRQQYIENISSLANLSLYTNICANYATTGGPGGPRQYAFEYAGYSQPYLSTFMVTQFIILGLSGWKHHRRLYPALISNSAVLFTVMTQDGRTYGPISIPSTGGQFKIVPIMLPQTIKDLAFAYQLDGQGQSFVLFRDAFTIETKEWLQPEFVKLAVFDS